MGEEVPVAFEDVEFFCGRGLVVATVGPSACGFRGIFGCKRKRALCDAEVEIGEHKLDCGEKEGGEGGCEDG